HDEFLRMGLTDLRQKRGHLCGVHFVAQAPVKLALQGADTAIHWPSYSISSQLVFGNDAFTISLANRAEEFHAMTFDVIGVQQARIPARPNQQLQPVRQYSLTGLRMRSPQRFSPKPRRFWQ